MDGLYANAFESAKPTLAHSAVSSRLNCSRALTTDLANYYKERILLEELYLKSLAKLNGKLSNELTPALAALPISPSQLQVQLGAWNDVLAQVAAELVTKSNSHQAFKLKVAEQVEAPLRNSLASRDWKSWTDEENRLAGTVKSFESEADKVQKAQSKSATKSSKSTTSKLLSAQSSLTFLSAELKSSLPQFLTISQSLETSQSNLIKEALLQYGTLSSDQARAEMEVGERFLGAVLTVEGDVEMRTWALREGLAAGGSSMGLIEEAPSVSEFGANNSTARGQAYGEAANDGTVRQSSGRGNQNVGGNLMDDNELLGTNGAMDRQGEMETLAPTSRYTPTALPPAIVIPPSFSSNAPQSLPLPSPALSTTSTSRSRSRQQPREERAAPPAVAPLDLPTVPPPPPPRSDSYRSQTETTSRETNPGGGGFKLPGFLGGNSGRDRTLSTSTSGENGGAGYGSLDVEERRRGDARSIDSRQSNDNYSATPRPEPAVNSTTPTKSVKAKRRESIVPFAANLFRRQSKMIPIPANFTPSTPLPPSPLPPASSSSSRDVPQPVPEPNRATPSRKNSTLAAGLVDEDGYSVKPDGYDRAISGGLMGADSDEEDLPSSTIQPVRINTVSMSSPVIANSETESERQAALERVKNTLLSSGSSSNSTSPTNGAMGVGLGGLARKATSSTSRGRRDANRLTMINPTIPDDVPLARVVEQQRLDQSGSSRDDSIQQVASPTSISSPIGSNFFGRANSMVSTRSSALNSSIAGRMDPFDDISEAKSGLRANLVETFNVLVKNGVISRVLITGELMLNLKPTGTEEALKFKLTNFSQFAKIAPNSSVLSSSGSPGEYTIDKTTSATGFGTIVALRYQLEVPAGEEENFIPLKVRSQWKIEAAEGRASVIIYYSINSSTKLIRGKTISDESVSPFDESPPDGSLDDIAFHVPLTVPITNYQSKPTATFEKEKNQLTFPIDQSLSFASSSLVETKLLARVNSTALENMTIIAQPIAVDWKISGRSFSDVEIEVVGGGVPVVEFRRAVCSGKYLIA